MPAVITTAGMINEDDASAKTDAAGDLGGIKSTGEKACTGVAEVGMADGDGDWITQGVKKSKKNSNKIDLAGVSIEPLAEEPKKRFSMREYYNFKKGLYDNQQRKQKEADYLEHSCRVIAGDRTAVLSTAAIVNALVTEFSSEVIEKIDTVFSGPKNRQTKRSTTAPSALWCHTENRRRK